MPNTDELAVQNYAHSDPQFVSEEQIERADMIDAVDELIDLLETAARAFTAVKQNFTTRRYNMMISALEEMIDQLNEVKADD